MDNDEVVTLKKQVTELTVQAATLEVLMAQVIRALPAQARSGLFQSAKQALGVHSGVALARIQRQTG